MLCQDLTWLIKRHEPAVWVHGHVHVPSDYAVGATRVLCNPRGHASEGRQDRWKPDLIVDV